MRIIIAAIILLWCSQLVALGQNSNYWVIASFDKLANAVKGKHELAMNTGLNIQIAEFINNGHNHYRLVVNQDADQSALTNAGITPWSISIDDEQMTRSGQIVDQYESRLPDYYLVLGGFRDQDAAAALVNQLQNLQLKNLQLQKHQLKKQGQTTLSIEQTSRFSAPWYRVLSGPVKQVDPKLQASFNGIADSWWIKKQPEVLAEFVESRMTRAPRKRSAGINTSSLANNEQQAPQAKAPEPKITPPRQNQSYLDYCIKQADALERSMFCKDGAFSNLAVLESTQIEADEVSGSDIKLLAEFCALKATAAERESYCTN